MGQIHLCNLYSSTLCMIPLVALSNVRRCGINSSLILLLKGQGQCFRTVNTGINGSGPRCLKEQFLTACTCLRAHVYQGVAVLLGCHPCLTPGTWISSALPNLFARRCMRSLLRPATPPSRHIPRRCVSGDNRQVSHSHIISPHGDADTDLSPISSDPVSGGEVTAPRPVALASEDDLSWLLDPIRQMPPRLRGILLTSVQGENASVLLAEAINILVKDAIEMSWGLYRPYYIVPKKVYYPDVRSASG